MTAISSTAQVNGYRPLTGTGHPIPPISPIPPMEARGIPERRQHLERRLLPLPPEPFKPRHPERRRGQRRASLPQPSGAAKGQISQERKEPVHRIDIRV